MADQIDLDRKPTLGEWLAEDAWFASLLRDVWREYHATRRKAYDEAMLRFGKATGPAGPQVRGA